MHELEADECLAASRHARDERQGALPCRAEVAGEAFEEGDALGDAGGLSGADAGEGFLLEEEARGLDEGGDDADAVSGRSIPFPARPGLYSAH